MNKTKKMCKMCSTEQIKLNVSSPRKVAGKEYNNCSEISLVVKVISIRLNQNLTRSHN